MTCWWWSRDSTGWWWRFCFLQKICWHFWDVLFLSKTVLLWSFNKFCYCWSPAQRRAREKKETWKWKIFMFLRYCLYCESAERHRKHSSIMKVNFTNPLKTPETNTSPTTSQQFLLSKTLFGVFFFFCLMRFWTGRQIWSIALVSFLHVKHSWLSKSYFQKQQKIVKIERRRSERRAVLQRAWN